MAETIAQWLIAFQLAALNYTIASGFHRLIVAVRESKRNQ